MQSRHYGTLISLEEKFCEINAFKTKCVDFTEFFRGNVEGKIPKFPHCEIYTNLFLSSLGDLLFSKLFPFLLLVLVILELGLAEELLAVLDLLSLFGLFFREFARLLPFSFEFMANFTLFCELAGLRTKLASLTGGALAMVCKYL